MKKITVSVPGKIHLIGEHMVVYGYPAIIAATNTRVWVNLIERNDEKIVISSKNLHTKKVTNFSSLKKTSQDARKSWEKFIRTTDVSVLKSISNDPLDYIQFAAFETLKFYEINEIKKGFSLDINSEIPIGSGSGSSAAIAVGVAAVITLLLKKRVNKKNIFKIALSTEELKHGTPSGGDPAVTLDGGVIWFQKQGKRTIRKINIDKDSGIVERFYIADTGKPNESTGEMIAKVRNLKVNVPEETLQIFDDQKDLTTKFALALKRGNGKDVKEIIKKAEKNLESIGVVSEKVTKIIREIEDAGGAAKISGAGGFKEASGMLLVYSERPKVLKSIFNKYGIEFSILRLGEKGLMLS